MCVCKMEEVSEKQKGAYVRRKKKTYFAAGGERVTMRSPTSSTSIDSVAW